MKEVRNLGNGYLRIGNCTFPCYHQFSFFSSNYLMLLLIFSHPSFVLTPLAGRKKPSRRMGLLQASERFWYKLWQQWEENQSEDKAHFFSSEAVFLPECFCSSTAGDSRQTIGMVMLCTLLSSRVERTNSCVKMWLHGTSQHSQQPGLVLGRTEEEEERLKRKLVIITEDETCWQQYKYS